MGLAGREHAVSVLPPPLNPGWKGRGNDRRRGSASIRCSGRWTLGGHAHALRRGIQRSTPIIIANRFSTLLHADKIGMLNRGGVQAVGRHAELLAGNDTYARLYWLQFAEAEAVGDL